MQPLFLRCSGCIAGLRTSTVVSTILGYNYYALYADVGTPAVNSYAAVFSNGNVGIGNLAPANKLDLTGDINISSGNELQWAGSP